MSASATRTKVAKGPPRIGGSLLRLAIALAAGYSILAVGLGYWQVVQSQNLSEDPRNPLVVQASGIDSPGLTACLAVGRMVA